MVRQSKRYTKRNTRRSRRNIKRGGGVFDFFSSKSDAQKAEEQQIEASCKQQLEAVAKKYASLPEPEPAPVFAPESPTPAPGTPTGQQGGRRRRRSRKY
jgi:hypothetical protein